MKIECPRCHQGWVKQVHIGLLNRDVFLCDECEATWFCPTSIEFATFVDLSTFLERLGIRRTAEVFATFRDMQA
jgi:hypothetical protein